MSPRILLPLAGLVFIVGGGTLWLAWQASKRKQLLKNLLSLPKERRFFWYKLRQAGYSVTSAARHKTFQITMNGEPRDLALKCDFTARRRGKIYTCLIDPQDNGPQEWLKLYFTYQSVFQTHGVIYYSPATRQLSVWE